MLRLDSSKHSWALRSVIVLLSIFFREDHHWFHRQNTELIPLGSDWKSNTSGSKDKDAPTVEGEATTSSSKTNLSEFETSNVLSLPRVLLCIFIPSYRISLLWVSVLNLTANNLLFLDIDLHLSKPSYDVGLVLIFSSLSHPAARKKILFKDTLRKL